MILNIAKRLVMLSILWILCVLFTGTGFAADNASTAPSPSPEVEPKCVRLCPNPKPKIAPKPAQKKVAPKPVQREPQHLTQDQDQSNEQDQHQTQTVNVYPNYGQVRERVVERTVVAHRENNRIGLLLGWGPKGCCLNNRQNDGLIGGAGYDRRIVGPLWLGVEVFTNYSYFGKIGIDF